MVLNLDRCIGCYNCQIACKDEHVGNVFPSIAKSQPTYGHFWIGIEEVERVFSPSTIKVTYIPRLCQHCDDAGCMKAAKDDAIYKRPDGIVIIDPVKAVGQKQLAEACPYGSIFWNEEENLPQKCTLCAHLLDDGWTEPRCVQTCPTNCMIFRDMDDPESEASKFLGREKGEFLHPEFNTKPNVYYVGLPKPHIAGTIIYGDKDECAGDVTVTLTGPDGAKRETRADFFGDFEFDGLERVKYMIRFDSPGYHSQTREIEITDDITYLGETLLQRSE